MYPVSYFPAEPIDVSAYRLSALAAGRRLRRAVEEEGDPKAYMPTAERQSVPASPRINRLRRAEARKLRELADILDGAVDREEARS